eukprot:172214-Chlamydomonas_euryale.AAC.2
MSLNAWACVQRHARVNLDARTHTHACMSMPPPVWTPVLLLFRLFQISSTPAQLKSAMPVQPPVELAVTMHGVALTVINLAEGLGHQAAYKTFDPVHQLPSINLAQGSSGGADGLHVPAHVQLQQSIEAAVNASAQQVSGLEAHFDDVLRQTSRLMHKVMDEAPALRQIRSENASLLQELDKLSA